MEMDTTKNEGTSDKPPTTHTLSLEVFISDDNIINTQESVDLDIDHQMKTSVEVEPAKQDVKVDEGKINKETLQNQERRSERLKKTATLTTMEKTGVMAQKKNLEGNPHNSNSFVALTDNDIIHITSKKGIVVENDSFETCNLLKALETARNDLYMKQLEKNNAHSNVSVENVTDLAEALALTWLHDESSEAEDFILVESRKKEGRKINMSKFLLGMEKRGKTKNILACPAERGKV
jgi:hypothetical protein